MLPGLFDYSSDDATEWHAPKLKELLDLDATLFGLTPVGSEAEADLPTEFWNRDGDAKFDFGEIIERYVDKALRDQIADVSGRSSRRRLVIWTSTSVRST